MNLLLNGNAPSRSPDGRLALPQNSGPEQRERQDDSYDDQQHVNHCVSLHSGSLAQTAS